MEKSVKFPKIDLHCHLDGSLSLETVRQMTGKKELRLEDLQAEKDCDSLKTYLEKFQVPLLGMQTEEGLFQAARDFLVGLKEDGIVYVEVRFAPGLSVQQGLSYEQVIRAVLEGMQEGERQTGIRWQVICCAMRHHTEEENLRMLKAARTFLGEGVCALDLAGDEAAWPVKSFVPLFQEAKRVEMPFTIHAGECGSAANIRDAIELGAGRIGHGIAMRGREELMEEVAKRKIGIELCPTSNYQTKALRPEEPYPLFSFLKKGILATVNTDNRTVSQTTMTKELFLVRELMKKQGEEIQNLERRLFENAVQISFLTEDDKERLASTWTEK